MQPKAKADLHNIWMAEGKGEATKAFDLFLEKYKAKYPKATDCLEKDRSDLLTFYDFPAEHWKHIRTTNPIESTFQRSSTEQDAQKGVLHVKQPSSWSSNLSKMQKNPGGNLMEKINCQSSSLVSNSWTVAKSSPLMN